MSLVLLFANSIKYHMFPSAYCPQSMKANYFVPFFQFGKPMDRLRGAMFVRVFGNELRYKDFDGVDSLFGDGDFNILELLLQLSKNHDYSYTQSYMFLDSSMVIPTSIGFPMNLTVNGSATIDLKASGKMDLRKLASSPCSLSINGIVQPR